MTAWRWRRAVIGSAVPQRPGRRRGLPPSARSRPAPARTAQHGVLLVLSALFLLAIVAAFVFTVRTIQRQKRLSRIRADLVNNMTHELRPRSAPSRWPARP